jgi:peptide/nickel transport system substrate-binding protein
MDAVTNNLIYEGSAFYTEGAAKDNDAICIDYIKGDSLELLEKSTTQLMQKRFVPYKELLEQYITPEDAKLRYDNMLKFYKEHGHFTIGLGPYVINNVDPLAPSLTLTHYDGLKISADKLASYYETK